MSTIYASPITTIYVVICTINPSSINIAGCTIIYPSIISINPPTHHVSIHPSTHVYYPCIIYLYYLCIYLSISSINLYYLSILTINLPCVKLFSYTIYHQCIIFINPSSHHLSIHPPMSTIYPMSSSTIIYESISIHRLSTHHFYQSIHP